MRGMKTPSTPPTSKAAVLATAIATRQAGIVELRKQHGALVDQLVDKPDDPKLYEQLEKVGIELLSAEARLRSLEQAAEKARDDERAAARDAARLATEAQRAAVLKAAADRERLAIAADAAGAAFVKALRDLREASAPITSGVSAVMRTRVEPGQYLNAVSQSLPHANATARPFATALAERIREAVAVIGSEPMNDLLVVNAFAETRACTFAGANAMALAQLEARL